MSETTATLLIGPANPWFAGRMFRAAHLLVLDEGDRASWRVIRLDPADTHPQQAPTPAQLGGPGIVGLPDRPEQLLAHGLLVFLASATSDLLSESPEVARLITADGRPGVVRTTVPDDQAAEMVYAAMPENAQVVMTVLPGSSLKALDAAGLVAAGAPVVTALGEGISI